MGDARRQGWAAALVAGVALLTGGAAPAQEAAAPPLETPAEASPRPARPSSLLTIDPEALYRASAWFRRVEGSVGAEIRAVAAENDRLAAELADEERALTERRAELPPEEFRRMAADFDQRVVHTRRAQDEKARRLNALAEAERAAFFRAAIPVFADVMQARKAVAVLDRQSVFISADAIDVTEVMAQQIDRTLGEGTPQVLPETAAPAGGATDAGAPPTAEAGPATAGGPDAAPDAGLVQPGATAPLPAMAPDAAMPSANGAPVAGMVPPDAMAPDAAAQHMLPAEAPAAPLAPADSAGPASPASPDPASPPAAASVDGAAAPPPSPLPVPAPRR